MSSTKSRFLATLLLAVATLDAFTLATGVVAGTGPIVGLASKCMDVSGNNSANGTQIHIWTCNGAANQRWTLP